jgi:predicted N-acetyltransferase YhbS
MIIRQENPTDIDAIRAVIGEAFRGTQEADLVDRLRSDNDLLVSLVAEHDRQIMVTSAFRGCGLYRMAAAHLVSALRRLR